MSTRVACGAECDQVFLGVLAGVAAKQFVMDLEVRHGATRLTVPAIAVQDLLSQALIRDQIHP